MDEKLLFINDAEINVSNGYTAVCKMNKEVLKDIYQENFFCVNLRGNEDKEDGTEYFFKDYTNGSAKLINIVCGHPTYLSPAREKKICQIIRENEITKVVVSSSTCGKLIRKIKTDFSHVIVANIFIDIEAILMGSQLSMVGIFRKLALLSMIRNEKLTVRYSDKKVVFNQRDADLYKQYYHKNVDGIIPIFIKSGDIKPEENKKADKKLNLLFVGVYYYPNVNGVKWFVKNVLPEIDADIQLNIVGRGMEVLKDKFQDERVNVIGGVSNIAEYYRDADIIIAPIFEGGGMKVKTAEAISYGKVVVGTRESLMGYYSTVPDQLLNQKIFRCENAQEYIEAIHKLSRTEVNKFNQDVYDWYMGNYSFEANRKKFVQLFK